MMTLTNSSRKRECSDESEYLPVTKRMNNLHIDVIPNDSNESLIGRQMNGLESETNERRSGHSGGQDSHRMHSNCEQSLNAMNCESNRIQNGLHSMNSYSPELDSNSNPIYYESNRILFEAHLQRVQRTGIAINTVHTIHTMNSTNSNSRQSHIFSRKS